jgi:hypothetical protein
METFVCICGTFVRSPANSAVQASMDQLTLWKMLRKGVKLKLQSLELTQELSNGKMEWTAFYEAYIMLNDLQRTWEELDATLVYADDYAECMKSLEQIGVCNYFLILICKLKIKDSRVKTLVGYPHKPCSEILCLCLNRFQYVLVYHPLSLNEKWQLNMQGCVG